MNSVGDIEETGETRFIHAGMRNRGAKLDLLETGGRVSLELRDQRRTCRRVRRIAFGRRSGTRRAGHAGLPRSSEVEPDLQASAIRFENGSLETTPTGVVVGPENDYRDALAFQPIEQRLELVEFERRAAERLPFEGSIRQVDRDGVWTVASYY